MKKYMAVLAITSDALSAEKAETDLYPVGTDDDYLKALGMIMNEMVDVIGSAQEDGNSIEDLTVGTLLNIGPQSFRIDFNERMHDGSISHYAYNLMEVKEDE